MSLEVCLLEEKKNLGKTKCTSAPKLFKRAITTPRGWFLDVADYASKAALKTKLQALFTAPRMNRGYLFPPFAAVPEDQSEESLYETTPYGRTPVRDGQYRFKHAIAVNLCTHIALQSHRVINDDSILYQDVDNQLLLHEPNGDGKLYPLSLSLLWTEKMKLSNGTDSTKSPFIVDLADNEEIDKYGVLIDGSVVNELDPLTDAELALTAGDAFAAAGFNVDVKQICDQVMISGLVEADFIMYASDGITPQAIDSVVEDVNNPGRYMVTAPGGDLFEDGFLTLVNPADLSIQAYEVPTMLTVNIP
jgi:hypothetical protein